MTTDLTTTQAAALLGVAPDTVKHFILRGQLAATKRGRDWWIDPDTLTAFAATRSTRPGWPKGKPRGPRKSQNNDAR